MKYIMTIIAALALTACGVDYTKSENSNNTTTTTTTTNTTIPVGSDQNTSTEDGLGIPTIADYSTGVVVLDCKNPSNVTSKAVYKCLRSNTKVGAKTSKGALTGTDQYRIDDRFVYEFSIDDVNAGDNIAVVGTVTWDDNSTIEFATASCKVGE